MNFNNIYICHFGCFMETTDKQHLIRHLVMEHTSKELLQWGYRKDKLKRMLSPEDLTYIKQLPDIDHDLEVYDEREHVKPLDKAT